MPRIIWEGDSVMQVCKAAADVSNALTYFHRRLYEEFALRRKAKTREFRRLIETRANEIKDKYRESTQKDLIRKALKHVVKQLRIIGDSITHENRIDLNEVNRLYFGGEALSTQKGSFYDLAIRKNEQELELWFFRPDQDQDQLPPNVATGIREAEEQFGLKCSSIKLLIKWGFVTPQFNIDMAQTESLVTQAIEPAQELETAKETSGQDQSLSLIQDQPSLSDTYPLERVTTVEDSTKEYIGWISLRENSPFILDQRKDEIPGYLKREFIERVNKGDWLVIEREPNRGTEQEPIKIFATLTSIETFNKFATALTKSVDETVHEVKLRPSVEIRDGKEGLVKARDLDHYLIRFPTQEEFKEILNLPETGFPIGWIQRDSCDSIVFRYPSDPEDTLYQSVMIAGVQRSGKTNFIKLLTRALATYRSIHLNKRPAIVILDVEGAFCSIPKLEELNPQTANWLCSNLLSNFEQQVIRISDKPNRTSSTLDLKGIRAEDLTYLLPELPPKSDTIVEEMIRECTRRLDQDFTALTLREEIIREVRSSQIIHREQARAIIRAFYSPFMRLFDQSGKSPVSVSEILKPGKVTVVDIFSLSDGQKRAVALYFLLMFDYYKMNSPK